MRRTVLFGVAVATMLLVSIAAIGSNMGFKISIPLYAGGAGHTGVNMVSLPYYVNYADAASVFADVPSCAEVDLWDEATGTYRVYDGAFNLDNFPVATGGQLVSANAILVKVGVTENWIVVGSHNPAMTVPLYAGGAGHTGVNFRSVPYHTTATSASVMFGAIPGCAELDLWDEAAGTFRVYDGAFNLDDFPITAGQPLVIKVGATANWTPAHY